MIDFKTYDEQIEILRSRGLRIFDSELIAAKDLLKRNNYYNVINGYKDLFIQKGVTPERYIDGVSLKEVFDFYQFDKELRLYISRVLIVVERIFSSVLSYEFSQNHPNHDLDYLNIDCYNTELTYKAIDDQGIEQPVILASSLIREHLLKEFNTAIDKCDPMVTHYKSHYNRVPLWVFVNKLSFGVLSKMYKCFLPQDRDAIAKSIGQLSNKSLFANDIQNALSVLVLLRNKCAHDQRIYDFDPSPTLIKRNDSLNKFTANQPYKRQSLFSALSCISLFVHPKEFSIIIKDFREIMKRNFSLIHSIPTQKILDKMGVPQSFLS